MGKVKIKRKSTLIDMTAMSDVTVLLLTFFMLTSTFLKKEPTTVQTPSSVSEEAVPAQNIVTILVSSADNSLEDPTSVEGKIFISFAGDSVLQNTELRGQILEKAVGYYNTQHPDAPIQLKDSHKATFAKIDMLGVPFSNLINVLEMDDTTRDKYLSDMTQPGVGIPIDMRADHKDKNGKLNEFQMWMKALSNVAQDGRDKKMEQLAGLPEDEAKAKLKESEILYNAVYQGKGVSVKADKDTPYSVVHEVFDNLQTMGLNKFTLMTALKSEDTTN
jgi:biopolymer transport protein ExbD